MENIEESFDIGEMQARGRFIENQEFGGGFVGFRENFTELESLGLPAGECVEGLTESEVAKADVDQWL